jgi:uncharacterized protein YcfJ
MGMYPGMSYGGYGGFGGNGGYGGYGGYGSNPLNGQGIAPIAVNTAPVKSTPLTPFEEVNGELHRDSASKKGLIMGGVGGAATGAALGFAVGGPVGAALGGLVGLFGGGLVGDKIGKLAATQSDVMGDGKADGNAIAAKESGSHGFLGVF